MYRARRGMEACYRESFTIGMFLDVCSQSRRLNVSSKGRGRDSLLLMDGEAAELFNGLRSIPVAFKKTKEIKMEGCFYA